MHLLCMILVFLSPPEPPETPYSNTNSNNVLVEVWTPGHLVRLVGGTVKCDSSSTVAGATCLIAGASGTTPNGGVRFPFEFSIMVGSFALGQVLNFGSLVYVADYYGEPLPLHRAHQQAMSPQHHPLRWGF